MRLREQGGGSESEIEYMWPYRTGRVQGMAKRRTGARLKHCPIREVNRHVDGNRRFEQRRSVV